MEKRFKTRAEVASILGIPRRTFSSYHSGQRHVINPDIRKKLFDLTGIESFKSDKPNRQEGILLGEWVNTVVEKPPQVRKDDRDKKDSQKDVDDDTHDDIDENGIDSKNENIIEDPKNPSGTNDSINNGNRPFLDMASDLRNWFNGQQQWGTKQEFADSIGISRSSMKKIFLGIREPKGDQRKKLYGVTKLECFKDIDQHVMQDQNDKMEIKIEQDMQLIEVGQQIKQVEQIIEQVEQSVGQTVMHDDKLNDLKEKIETHTDANYDVEKLTKRFYSLARALEPFKNSSPEQRKKVKEKILAQDLGYVMSFMKAMYDEDSFTDFMFFSEYTLKGGGSDNSD